MTRNGEASAQQQQEKNRRVRVREREERIKMAKAGCWQASALTHIERLLREVLEQNALCSLRLRMRKPVPRSCVPRETLCNLARHSRITHAASRQTRTLTRSREPRAEVLVPCFDPRIDRQTPGARGESRAERERERERERSNERRRRRERRVDPWSRRQAATQASSHARTCLQPPSWFTRNWTTAFVS